MQQLILAMLVINCLNLLTVQARAQGLVKEDGKPHYGYRSFVYLVYIIVWAWAAFRGWGV